MLVGDRARDAAGSRAQVGHEQRRGNGRGIVRRGRGGAGPGGVRKRGRRFGGGLIDLGCILRGAGREQLFGFGLGHARVERARPARCGQKGERLAHQHLGLGTGDEHAGAHLHRDMAKRHLAGDVLQRLAPAPPRHVVAQRVALLERQRPLQSGVQLDPAKPARLADQPFCRQARVLVALALKVAHRPLKGGLDGPDVAFSHGFQPHRLA